MKVIDAHNVTFFGLFKIRGVYICNCFVVFIGALAVPWRKLYYKIPILHTRSRARYMEVQALADQGDRILLYVQGLRQRMPSSGVAEVSSWVTRLGRFITESYGEASQHYSNYSKALATPDFYGLHSGFHAHIAQLVGIAQSIRMDLYQNRIPKKRSATGVNALTNENDIWWFIFQCTPKTRIMLCITLLSILASVTSTAYFAGRNDFINRLVDDWKQFHAQASTNDVATGSPRH